YAAGGGYFEAGDHGRSGGGTQTAMISAFDMRLKAAAPENYITNFRRLFEAMGPQDAEQDLPGELAKGLDMADLLEVRAPKPALVIATTQDMFPIQGAIETSAEVARAYRAFGVLAAANFRMVMDDAPHASTLRNREAAYAFFERVLNNPGDSTEVKVVLPSVGELRVSVSGQVGGMTAWELNAKRRIRGTDVAGMLSEARRLSGYREPAGGAAPWC